MLRAASGGGDEGPHALCQCVCGSRLASSSYDSTIKVWIMRAGLEWACERTLEGQCFCALALAAWGDMLISGSEDGTIRVWDLSTGELDDNFTGIVCALVVEGGWLYSASEDGGHCPRRLLTSGSKLISGSFVSDDDDMECEVRVWDLDTMACEQKVLLAAGEGVRCLSGAGGAVWGGMGRSVLVWGFD
jgi:WD40 repeat protein